MALTADEQALLERLSAKASEPVAKKVFESVGDVLTYLVTTSDKFTANPDDRQVALDVIKAAYPVVETIAEDA
jgi:hypothetical protein